MAVLIVGAVLAQFIDGRIVVALGLILLGLRVVHLRAKARFYRLAMPNLTEAEAWALANGGNSAVRVSSW